MDARTPEAAASDVDAGADARTPPSAWYGLSLLFAAYILSTLDRAVVGLVSEPLKHDLHLTDTALGFINGAGFVLFYVLFGIPLARWSDKGVRRSILALGVFVWSLMMALSGLVQNFVQLVAARAGLAIGEAAGVPTSLSLISDLFPPGARMRATSIFQAAPFFGIMLGLPLIGAMVTHFGWRSVMMVLGAPGLILALVIRLSFKEPKRGLYDPPRPATARDATIWETLVALAGNRAFALMTLGLSFSALAGYAQSGFVPAYMQRTHGMTQMELGLYMGPLVGGAAMVGTVGGGFLADALRKRTGGDYWPVALFVLAHALGGVAMGVFLGAADRSWMLAGGVGQSMLNSLKSGPFIAIALASAPANMRGLAATVLVVIATSVIGGVFGPLLVGLVSDALTSTLGPLALRSALLWVCCGSIAISSVIFVFVLAPIRQADRRVAAA